MKYTIVINQAGIAAAGLADKTNLDHWAILDYIAGWQINHHATLREGHVWINLKHMLGEMPLLRTQTKQGLSKLIQQLQSLGLVTAIHDADKRLYLKLTPLYHDTVGFRACQQNSDGVNHGGQGVNSGGQRPVNSGGHTAVNQFSIDNQDTLKGYSAFAEKDNPELFPAESLSQNSTEPQNLRSAPKENIPARPKPDYAAQFEQFWLIYPRKVAKGAALKAFNTAMKTANFSEIMDAVRRYGQSRPEPQFTPHPATWLNGQRWLDETPEAQNGRQNYSHRPTRAQQIAAALDACNRDVDENTPGRAWAEEIGGNADPVFRDPEHIRATAGIIDGDYTVVSE